MYPYSLTQFALLLTQTFVQMRMAKASGLFVPKGSPASSPVYLRLACSSPHRSGIFQLQNLKAMLSFRSPQNFVPMVLVHTYPLLKTSCFCWLCSLKEPTGRIGRAALRLAVYRISVLYKSLRLHEDAVCLSCLRTCPPDRTDDAIDACVLSITNFLHITIQQSRDRSLRFIIERLTAQHLYPTPPFFIRDHVLY